MRKLLFLLTISGLGALPVFSQATNEYEAELSQGQVSSVASYAGSWRGVFQIRPGVEAPFNFDIRNGRDGAPELFFRNAEESFEGGAVERKGDSLFVALDQFDNQLAFRAGEGALTGVLRRQDGRGEPLPVTAQRDSGYRFKVKGEVPSKNISGTYAVAFVGVNGKEEHSVGIFRQQGSRLYATFLHVTGDSRYLEGVVEGSDFEMSSFIGSGPSLYVGRIAADGSLSGQTIGVHGGQRFSAVVDAGAALPDAYALTYVKDGVFDFSFPDVSGRRVSLRDAKYRNKVVVVTIGGTWCPNCIDETEFLAPWYRANRSRGVEIISIQYERQADSAFVRKALTRMRTRFDIQYDQVIGGVADKQVVAASLPALNTFLSFPTTLFIDRQGRVARVHTGFNGPATGHYYDEFKKEFNDEVDALLK